MRAGGLLFLVCLVLAIALSATADGTPAAPSWLPHAADATWEYSWTDSAYNTTPTKEKVTVDKSSSASAFQLDWTTDGENNDPAAPVSAGFVAFQEQYSGIFTTNWNSNAPPPNFPTLCPAVAACGNSLSSAYYNVIWGSRSPTLVEPLLQNTTWPSTGGAGNDVTSANDYIGTEQITVPVFPQPVVAAKVRSQITQAGALGDQERQRRPHRLLGVRRRSGEGRARPLGRRGDDRCPPVDEPDAGGPPPDANYFPLKARPEGKVLVDELEVHEEAGDPELLRRSGLNGSAQISVASVSGPIKVTKGAYGFTSRLDGVTNLFGATQAQSLAKAPPLGPRSLGVNERRHFFTPFDLMTYGFNPVIPAYPAVGTATAASPPSS